MQSGIVSATSSDDRPSCGTPDEHRFAPRLVESHDRLLAILDAAAAADAPIVSEALSTFMACKGKLLRPLLTLLCCEITGGDPLRAVPLAAAVELVHCSSLILDDLPCMDNASTRRGRPSLHNQFGEAVAILTSVHLLSHGFRITAEAGRTLEQDLVGMLADAISRNGMIRGQAIDLAGGGNTDAVRSLKTAPLFRVGARFGAAVANAPAWQVEALSNFANSLSLVFQVRDDIIDGQADVSQFERATAIGSAAAAELGALFGDKPACQDLRCLIGFALSRSI
jgi:geranylgeranyl diphosphate synthase type II